MPITTVLQTTIQLPTIADFLNRYPHYSSVRTSESFLWNLIVTAENAVAASVATRLRLPAVAVVADPIASACESSGRDLSRYLKQMSGAIMCSLMIANGHEPTGTKKAVGRPGWTKGEMYSLNALASPGDASG